YDLNDRTERHYQVVFYLIFRLLGQYCRTEVKNATGRADAIVEAGDYVYCFEFKLHDTAEAALAQIDSREYLTPYEGSGKKLVKVGVEFDKEMRNVGRYLTEEE
ncbi:MAG: PD-(D/E)XK nuclease domain-containing protein, partial [Fibrobacterota bacterium]